MTLLGLPLPQLAALLGAFGAAVTVLYILRLRRRRVQVPFAKLWRRVLREKESTSLFRRLKRLLSLLLQLCFLFLLTAALGDPRLSTELLAGRSVVLLIDASASMQATDGEGGTRIHTALSRARELVRGMSGADTLMIVRMDAQVTPLSSFESDEKTLLRALEVMDASDTRADLGRALKFSADALRGRKNPLLVLIGDGAYPQRVLDRVLLEDQSGKAIANQPAPAAGRPARSRSGLSSPIAEEPALDSPDLRGIPVRFMPVGRSGDNLGIVAFSARRYSRNRLSFEVFLEVVNHRQRAAEADLQLSADGEVIEVQRLSLKPGERARYTCDPEGGDRRKRSWCQLAAGGGLLEARLLPAGGSPERSAALDVFPLDDRAYALLPKQRKLRVLLASRGNLYLEGALLLDENLELTRVAPASYTPGLAQRADVLVFDGFFPKEAPKRPFLLVNPPAEGSPFPLSGHLPAPLVTEQDHKHPVMRWVTLKDLNVSSSAAFAAGTGVQALASSFRRPLIVAREQNGVKSVALGFDITKSDLPLRVAFPLLVVNSMDWFAGSGESLISTLRTGHTWSLDLASRDAALTGEAELIEPGGLKSRAPIQGGRITVYGNRVGIYTIRHASGETQIAANLADSEESQVRPRRPLTMGGRSLAAPSGFGIGLRREIWVYFLLAALGLCLVEWLSYNRRLTV